MAPEQSYLWEVPYKPVAVRLGVELVDRLAREAREMLRSVTSRGCELGGLLLGHSSGAHSWLVTVLDYQFVECSYGRSSFYELEAADVDAFRRAIEAQDRAAHGLQVVGYFRSNVRPSLSLKDDEIEFCRAVFGRPHQVALLIRPQRITPAAAGIFIWENGEMRGESSYREFPCARAELLAICPVEDQPEPERAGYLASESREPLDEAESAGQADAADESTGSEAAWRANESAAEDSPDSVEKEERSERTEAYAAEEAPESAVEETREPEETPAVYVRPQPVPSTTPIINIVSRRRTPAVAAVAVTPEAHELELEDPRKRARVGRCCTSVEFRPIARRSAAEASRIS